MSEFQEPIHHTTAETPRWVGLAVALLGGVSLIGIGTRLERHQSDQGNSGNDRSIGKAVDRRDPAAARERRRDQLAVAERPEGRDGQAQPDADAARVGAQGEQGDDRRSG